MAPQNEIGNPFPLILNGARGKSGGAGILYWVGVVLTFGRSLTLGGRDSFFRPLWYPHCPQETARPT